MKPTCNINDCFDIQFVWRLPDEDFIRVFFKAEVLEIQRREDRYLVKLVEFVAGRQESPDGHVIRPKEELSREYWAKVVSFVGKKVQVAYEAADSRPLLLTLATLTGENKFFRRFDDVD